jgi:hypothetical protein
MTNNSYPNVKSLINSVLSKSQIRNTLKECRMRFIINVLICFSCVKGKINFLQLQRFSGKSEQYFRINFENRFNFQSFNLTLIQERGSECIIAFDPSYIPKSGKQTYGLGSYWSGCAGSVKRGLEICGFAAVDVNRNTAFHLNAVQTPQSKDVDLVQHYCELLKGNSLYFKEISNCFVADSFFAKLAVVKTVTDLKMRLICRLRDDASLLYLNLKPKTGEKGRPKKYDGSVNPAEPDMNHFKLVLQSKEEKIYNATVYYPAWKRNINLSIVVYYDKKGKETVRKLYFSTDMELDGVKLVYFYRARFQIEFLYRDAKQHCGLEDCQARSKNKLNFHFNAALTTVNLAKLHWLDTRKSDNEPFSMANYKTMCRNRLMLNRFFAVFAINPNNPKNQSKINELLNFGLITA